jgi:outer membrane protein assembly factor BamC
VLNRLVIYLGGSEQTVARLKAAEQVTTERARVEGDLLLINEGFARSWRRIGIALDSLGVVVEDRNRAEGIYYVGQIELLEPQEDKKGWLSSIFAAKKEEKPGAAPELQIVLRGDESQTRVAILNMDGSPRQDKLADELLQRLQQELK